jgi:hypothetical protein
VATFAILAYPLLAVLLFRALPFRHALVAVVLGGMLLLPSRFAIRLSGLPNIDREYSTIVALLLCVLIYHGSYARESRQASGPPQFLPGWLPRDGIVIFLFVIVIVGQFFTVLTNMHPTNIGWLPHHVRGGLGLWDIPSSSFAILSPLAFFLVGRRYFCTPEAHRVLLLIFVGAALIYSLPALWEIRMSPRLHADFYGFFPHSWRQVFRGGWRPQVFMGHGLQLATFNAMAVLGALALWKGAPPGRSAPYLMIAVWIGAVLLLSNSLGAVLIAMVLAPVIFFLSPRLQIFTAAAVAALVVAYPILRGVGISPLQPLVDYMMSNAVGRGWSLNYRLENEGMVLDRAGAKPLFGWGTWGRWMVIPEGEGDTRPADGAWVIYMGQYGWAGFLGIFGLLTLGILSHLRGRLMHAIPAVTAGLAVVLAANLFDLIPNSFASPLTWFMAGALVGHVEFARAYGTDPAKAYVPNAPLPSGLVSASAMQRSAPTASVSGQPASGTAPDRGDRGGSRYTRFGSRVPRRRRESNA